MAIEGWYYLHTNGSMIYKRELGETVADLRESDFVRGIWPLNPTDRAGAWTICIEGLAAGADPMRIKELAEKWQCDDDDAGEYARRIGCLLARDGDQFMATRGDFGCLADSPAGFGITKLEAMAELAKALGYKPSKMWVRCSRTC